MDRYVGMLRIVAFVTVIPYLSEARPVLPGPVRLNPPQNLQVGLLNENTAWLSWRSPHLPFYGNLEGLTFHLTVLNESNIVQEFLVKPRAHYEIRNLKPNAKYFVEVYASHSGWLDSPKITGEFNTLDSDWPVPKIESVQYSKNLSRVYYEAIWSINETSALKNFTLTFCQPTVCFSMPCAGNVRRHEFSVKAHTKFNVTVTAIFGQPVIGDIKRISLPLTRDIPRVEVIQVKLFKMEHRGEPIEVEWVPPNRAVIDIAHYELHIVDPYNASSLIKLELPPEKKKSFRLPALPTVGRECHVILRAKGVPEHLRKQAIGDFKFVTTLKNIPARPRGIKILERAGGSIRFKITPGAPEFGGYFQVMNNATKRSYMVRALGSIPLVPAYVPVRISAKACHRLSPSNKAICGTDIVTAHTITNVRAPSRVQNVRVFDIPGEPARMLTWERPASPHGPIDGYRIVIFGSNKDTDYVYTQTIQTRMTFLKLSFPNIKIHRIGVVAYNIDLENRTREHISALVHASELPEELLRWFLEYVVSFTPYVVLIIVYRKNESSKKKTKKSGKKTGSLKKITSNSEKPNAEKIVPCITQR